MSSSLELDVKLIPHLKTNPVLFAEKVCRAWPYWYQKSILLCDSKNISVRQSRQTGKTWILALKALHAAYAKPGAIDPDDEYVIMIFAPTQKQSGIMFSRISSIINTSPVLNNDIENMIQTKITFKNGSVIYNYPIGEYGDNVRGFSVNILIIDEAAYIKDVAYDSITPSLLATDGALWLISTPKARYGHFYNTFKKGLDYKDYWKRRQANYTGISKYNKEDEIIRQGLYDHAGQSVTFWFPYTVGQEVKRRNKKGEIINVPQITDRIIQYARSTMHPVKFAKEYLAMFVDESNMYFPLELLVNSTDNYPIRSGPLPGYTYFMGVDFAKVQDYYIALVLESPPAEEEESLRVVYWQQELKRDYSITIPRTAQIARMFGAKTLYCDATGVGAPNVEKLTTMLQGISKVEGIVMSNKRQNEMYANVFELLGSGKLRLPASNTELLNQMQLITMEELPGGQIRIAAAEGNHDDYPDALALACLATLEPRHELFFTSTKSIFAQESSTEVFATQLGTNYVHTNDSRLITDADGSVIAVLPKDWR